MSRHSSRRFAGIDYCNRYVLANLSAALVFTGILILLCSLVYPFRWYWLLAASFALFWLVALVIERHPLGTYLLRRFFRE